MATPWIFAKTSMGHNHSLISMGSIGTKTDEIYPRPNSKIQEMLKSPMK